VAPTALYALNSESIREQAVQRRMIGRGRRPRLQLFVLIETRSAPALARCYPRSFTFYIGNPFPSFVVNELRWASNEEPLRALCNADCFPTFKIFAGRTLFDDASLQVNRGDQTHQEEAARTRVRRVRDDFWLVTADV
jgi:hypothetical protein